MHEKYVMPGGNGRDCSTARTTCCSGLFRCRVGGGSGPRAVGTPHVVRGLPRRRQHPLVDLGARHGLVGRRIEAVHMAERPDADEPQLEFNGGVVVALRDLSDRDATDLEIRAPAA